MVRRKGEDNIHCPAAAWLWLSVVTFTIVVVWCDACVCKDEKEAVQVLVYNL